MNIDIFFIIRWHLEQVSERRSMIENIIQNQESFRTKFSMNGCRIMQERGHMLHQYALGGAQCVMQSLQHPIADKVV